MASSTLQFYPESAAGRVSWRMPRSIRACETRRSALPAPRRTCRSTPRAAANYLFSNSGIPARIRTSPLLHFLLRTRRMNSRASAPVLFAAVLLPGCAAAASAASNELRVCADPNNMPFSNSEQAGFENKIAELAAQKLGKTLSYTWWAQRRGFVRNTLKAGLCDVVVGVPAHYDLVENTRPYYRSTYVFVSRADRHLDLGSMADPRLKQLRVGVHLIGDDGSNTPPAHALGDQGIVDNVRGYVIYGDYREPDPPARLIEAVENGEIDVAAAWGPLAGYVAKTSTVPLTVTPIAAGERFAPQQFQFEIAMGVRKGDHALRDRLNDFIAQNGSEIAALLAAYGVPLAENPRPATGGESR